MPGFQRVIDSEDVPKCRLLMAKSLEENARSPEKFRERVIRQSNRISELEKPVEYKELADSMEVASASVRQPVPTPPSPVAVRNP